MRSVSMVRRRACLAGLITVLVILSLLAGGCRLFGGWREVAVVDGAGREVRLEKEPKRIISMAPSNTEILFALGLGDRVVGVTTWCLYPDEVAGLERVGDAWSTDYEKIVSLDPDLVFAVGTAASQIVTGLESRGIRVFVLQAATVAQVADDIELVGRITGEDEAATRLASNVRARVAAVTEKLKTVEDDGRTSVFWVLDDLLWTVGPGSFVHDLIVLAGGRNIAENVGMAYAQFSMESLLAADPDVIVVPLLDPAAAENLAHLPGWATLSAVREGRVYQVDPDIVSQPVPRIAEGLELIARLLYPELFED